VQATPSPDLRAQILADVNAGVCLNVTGWTERLHITSRQWYPLIMPLRRDKLIYHSPADGGYVPGPPPSEADRVARITRTSKRACGLTDGVGANA
jgi:hypothetical protein